MMRVIHFFNIKEDADKEQVLHFFTTVMKDHTMTRGCVERRTLKLLDAHEEGEAVSAPQYINESWWPDVETSMAAFSQDQQTPEFSEAAKKTFEQIEMVRTVRYEEF